MNLVLVFIAIGVFFDDNPFALVALFVDVAETFEHNNFSSDCLYETMINLNFFHCLSQKIFW